VSSFPGEPLNLQSLQQNRSGINVFVGVLAGDSLIGAGTRIDIDDRTNQELPLHFLIGNARKDKSRIDNFENKPAHN
jgi:hypothetical protein